MMPTVITQRKTLIPKLRSDEALGSENRLPLVVHLDDSWRVLDSPKGPVSTGLWGRKLGKPGELGRSRTVCMS